MSSRSSTVQAKKKLFCQPKFNIQLFLVKKTQNDTEWTQNEPWVRRHLPHGFSLHDGMIQKSWGHNPGSTGWQLFEALLPEHLKTAQCKIATADTMPHGSQEPKYLRFTKSHEFPPSENKKQN
jgi:hypothetical protein